MNRDELPTSNDLTEATFNRQNVEIDRLTAEVDDAKSEINACHKIMQDIRDLRSRLFPNDIDNTIFGAIKRIEIEISELQHENAQMHNRILRATDIIEAGEKKRLTDELARLSIENETRKVTIAQAQKVINGESEKDTEIKRLEAYKNNAYAERDKLVAALSKCFYSYLGRHTMNEEWEDDWRWIVFIELPTGQVSWHIHDSELSMFDHLGRIEGSNWDGHTTEEKYTRLAKLSALKPEPPQEVTKW